MTQTPGQDPEKDRRMAEALERGMPAAQAAQAVYGTGPDRKVSIELTISLELEPEEAWPDGVPEAWTAEDVLAEMRKSGSAERLIKEWDLLTFGAEVEVQTLGTSAKETLK